MSHPNWGISMAKEDSVAWFLHAHAWLKQEGRGEREMRERETLVRETMGGWEWEPEARQWCKKANWRSCCSVC